MKVRVSVLGLAFSSLLIASFVSASSPGSSARPLRPTVSAGEAKRGAQPPARWSSGIKQFYGTAYEAYDSKNRYSGSSPTAPVSRVWFTGAQGVVTEVFWPQIDTPQVRDSQILATDGTNFFFEERRDSVTTVDWLAKGIPAYRITNAERNGRFTIERTIFTDPSNDALVQQIRITKKVPGLKFFVLHNPAVGNTPMGNSARVRASQDPSGQPAGLFAWQEQYAQAVLFSVPVLQASAGFENVSDVYQDLRRDLRMDSKYATAINGNVAALAWLDLPADLGVSEFSIILGFGRTVTEATQVAQATLSKNLASVLNDYTSQWAGYQSSIFDLGGVSQDGGKLFRNSVALLKSMEDKTHEGGFVASPSKPWGEHQEDRNSERFRNGSRAHLSGGYHLVWPRDLYHVATTFMAMKDYRSAVASLNFLKRVQYDHNDGMWDYGFRKRSRDGSYPQNMWLNGEPYWSGLQSDQTAFPLILAYRLWRDGQIHGADYWDMVRRGADFIQEYGPWSAQERWEENFGASPSTIASQITALWTAAEMAEANQDPERAARYRATADAWSSKPGDNLDTWTFTRSGAHGNGKYYQRIEGASRFDQFWNPDDDAEFWIQNNGGRWREKDVLDGGFLELVRLGVRNASDYHILETIPEYDATIRIDLPGIGPGFRRYLHDRYNYDDVTGEQTLGMIWPFLTGERAHHELQLGIEQGLKVSQLDQILNPYILTMEKMAMPSSMLPEQIWDFGARAGKPTGAATPLGWTHGEYIKLLRSRSDRVIFDRVVSVALRASTLQQKVQSGSSSTRAQR